MNAQIEKNRRELKWTKTNTMSEIRLTCCLVQSNDEIIRLEALVESLTIQKAFDNDTIHRLKEENSCRQYELSDICNENAEANEIR